MPMNACAALASALEEVCTSAIINFEEYEGDLCQRLLNKF